MSRPGNGANLDPSPRRPRRVSGAEGRDFLEKGCGARKGGASETGSPEWWSLGCVPSLSHPRAFALCLCQGGGGPCEPGGED